jgi:SAM-dependent methyltransferase
MSEAIRQYQEDRARANPAAPEATTSDVYLRELETATLIDTLRAMPASRTLLDVGCGDGQTTMAVADAPPELRFVGIDYSDNMIGIARSKLVARPHLEERVSFRAGDVFDLGATCEDTTHDAVTTDRCRSTSNPGRVEGAPSSRSPHTPGRAVTTSPSRTSTTGRRL